MPRYHWRDEIGGHGAPDVLTAINALQIVFSWRENSQEVYARASGKARDLHRLNPNHPLPFFVLEGLPGDPFPGFGERRAALLRRFVDDVADAVPRPRNEVLYTVFSRCADCLHAAILDELFPKVREAIPQCGKDMLTLAIKCDAAVWYIEEVVDLFRL